MEKLEKPVTIYVDSELRAWLDRKASQGYKIGSLIRHMLRNRMECEKVGEGQKTLDTVGVVQ